jgi:hypothetical protein
MGKIEVNSAAGDVTSDLIYLLVGCLLDFRRLEPLPSSGDAGSLRSHFSSEDME